MSSQERRAEDGPALRLVGAFLSVKVPNQIRRKMVGGISIIRTSPTVIIRDNEPEHNRTEVDLFFDGSAWEDRAVRSFDAILQCRNLK